jgi:hypothetical protein
MSKRKRDRLDSGRVNQEKKLKPSNNNERGAIFARDHDGLMANDQDIVPGTVNKEAEAQPSGKPKKSKRANSKEDNRGALMQNAVPTNATPPTMAIAGNKLTVNETKEAAESAQRLAKIERRKSKKIGAGEHAPDVVPNQRKSSRHKRRDHSHDEKYFWRISDAMGGQMLDLDPIFALNEE